MMFMRRSFLIFGSTMFLMACEESQEPTPPAFEESPLMKIDECAADIHDCSQHATCFDRAQGYICSCEPGFEGDGKVCDNIDECAAADTCDATATCMDTFGGHECACAFGWRPKGERACEPACDRTYTAGHGDVFISYEEERGLFLSVRSALDRGDSIEHLYPPEEVCIIVPRASYDETIGFGGRPPGDEWAALGVPEGQPFWYLPEVAIEGRPWFGMSAESVPYGLFVDDLVNLELEAQRMPGGAALSVFDGRNGDGTPYFIYSTVTGARTTELPVGVHQHMSWTFSHAGDYFVLFTPGGSTLDGELVAGDASVYRFIVE